MHVLRVRELSRTQDFRVAVTISNKADVITEGKDQWTTVQGMLQEITNKGTRQTGLGKRGRGIEDQER